MTLEDGNARYLFFGDFRLDRRTGELQRSGFRVRLQAQPAKLLVLLASRADEVVTRSEIQKALWGDDTFVDFELGINFSIKQIRDALGDRAENPHFVERVPREGYRFIAPIEGRGGAELELESSPYPGLLSFSANDAGFFFGRQEEVQTLWAKVERRPLAALIGPSGAGKTSLLQAGLIPARPPSWGALLCRPRESPLSELSAILSAELSLDQPSASVGDLDETLGLLRKWGACRPHSLLCIDAFEELFTLNDETTRVRFVDLIGKAVESDIHVLLAMRDDFFVHCHDHPGLAPVFHEVTPLKPLRGPSLRQALVEPARRWGYQFEDETLVAEILAEVTNERGALPLLAFAAARLWEKRDRGRSLLTRKAYVEIGGVGGALAQHAEAALAAIGPDGQAVAREIFRNLTTARGTRAAQDRTELLSIFEDRETAAAVLGMLVDARLLTSSGREVEIIHESLLSAWPRLVQWQAQDAEGAVFRGQLRQAARAWHERGRPDDLLWTGNSFRELALWRERYGGGLTGLEQAFVGAATRVAGRKRRLRLIAIVVLVSVSIAVAAVTSSLWRRSRAEAFRAEASKLLALAELRLQEDPTEALAFATASLELADTLEARVFALKALWEAPPALEIIGNSQAMRAPAFSPDGRRLATAGQATEALVWSEDGEGPLVLPGHETTPRGPNLAEWASNDLLVTGSYKFAGSRAYVWSLPAGTLLRSIDAGGPSSWQVGSRLLFAETLESGSMEKPGDVLLRSWALPDGEAVVLGRLKRVNTGTSSTFFAPDGSRWFYAKGRALYSHPLPDGHGPELLFARLGSEDARFSTSSDRIVVADPSGEIRVWTFAHRVPARQNAFARPEAASQGMFPDPSGRWLGGVASVDKQARLWELGRWKQARPLSLRRSGSWYDSISRFHPAGKWMVASTSHYTRLTFWPIEGAFPSVVDGYATVTRPLAFSPDGKWLATNWDDRWLRLWPLPGSGMSDIRSFKLPDAPFRVRSLSFDPTGRYIFAVGARDRAWIVPVDGSPARKLPAFSEDSSLNAGAISPSGRLVATAFWYGRGETTLRVWNIETGELRSFALPESGVEPSGPAEKPTGYERGIFSLVFVDETTLYTAGDRGIRRWNLESGSNDLVVEATPGYHMLAAFSSGGRFALAAERRLGRSDLSHRALLLDLTKGTSRPSDQFGAFGSYGSGARALHGSGMVAATGSLDGIVRVGRLSGEEPHLLIGHRGAIDFIEISPDLRWVATTGEDNTLRLWPMPDLSEPPLHTLPHDELLSKLRSLTNLRVVRDPASAAVWKVEVGPFPGWKKIPNW
jgi:WD40 repeat protein/DNA-binding winged helix-turn-helix (wHTH) protein